MSFPPEDHSKLFKEIGGFSQRKLKKVETKVVTGLGENVIEKRGAKGLQSSTAKGQSNDPASNRKLDLQVGLVAPGLMIGSQDVASHKQTIEEYGITHILNLASQEVDNHFEDEYNYLSLNIPDRESTSLEDFYEEAFDFIDEGRHQGNCLVHCNANKPGLNRSTSICIAYLMKKDGKRFEEAFTDVKEARSFVRPSDSFTQQLKKLDEQLFGENKKDDIDDAFTKKKRQEIEAEKAALQNAVKLKDRVKLFAASPEIGLDVNGLNRGCESPVSAGGVKNKWNPGPSETTLNKCEASRLAYQTRKESIDGSTGGTKKLTSIIGLFNKPKEETATDNNRFSITKNTAPAKKWKTVEPPPRPGTVQLKRNKSRKFYTDPTIRRNKSKGNLKQQPSLEVNNNCTSVPDKNQSSSVKQQPESVISGSDQNRKPITSTLTRQSSSSSRSQQSNGVTVTPGATAAPTPSVTKTTDVVPKYQQMKSVPNPPAPPPPPPPVSFMKPQYQAPTPAVDPVNQEAGSWRKYSNGSNDAKSSATASPRSESRSVSPATSDSSSMSGGRRKPSIELSSRESPPSQYRTTFSVNTTRRGSKAGEEATTANVPVPPTPATATPPPTRMVFGKVKPPQLKICGSSLSTERSTAPPPPPPPPAVNIRTTPATPVRAPPEPRYNEVTSNKVTPVAKPQPQQPAKQQPTPQRKKQPVYESFDDDSDSDADSDEDGYTQIYDHRRSSENKGLNRSSTMEILNLIKSKTGSNLAAHAHMDDIDEDDEIEGLLQGLETEGIENVDWGELGIDLGEVKNIMEKHEDDEDEDTEEYCGSEESEDVTADEEDTSVSIGRPRVRY